jgi:hypothetical protein
MRDEEAFVGHALVAYLGGAGRARFEEGGDPPDLLLFLDGERIGVEVTRLSQITLAPDGRRGNRATEDSFGLRAVDELDVELGPLLPDGLDLLIHLQLPVRRGGKFKAQLAAWIRQTVGALEDGMEEERTIEGASVRVHVVRRRPSGKRIVGLIQNLHSSADIGWNAARLLEDRIGEKHDKCKGLAGGVWLALLNDYWVADSETYRVAMRGLRLQHCFERILFVREDGHVTDLHHEA